MKKIKIFSAAFLAAMTLGLASCGDVEMSLGKADQNETILKDTDVFGNKLLEIYDKVVVSGDTNSEKILNNVLYLYAKSYFGDFFADYTCDTTGTWKLNDGVKPAAFFREGVSDEVATTKALDFHNSIVTSIMKSFWSVVSNSSYQKNQRFHEELFVKAQRDELYKLDSNVTFKNDGAIDGSKTYKDVMGYFHVQNDQFFSYYKDYIERSLLPNAYRKALVEQYLIDNNYGALGRSYARKVQYVALPNLDKYESSTRSLVRAYCKHVLDKQDSELGEFAGVYKDLHFLNRLYSGYFTAEEQTSYATVLNSIYSEAGFTAVAAYNVTNADGDLLYTTEATYRETTYGQLVLDFKDLSDSRWETGSTTDFTNSGAYTKVTGLEMKTRDIVASSKVTEGWYTSSGLSDLPSSMKTRLFKTQVANEVDNPAYADKPVTETIKDTFTWRVQGKYYLRPETIQTGEAYPYAMYDDSGKTWYIVRVDEAVKSPKLQSKENSDTSYENRTSGETMNQIIWDIADLIGDGDSSKKAARQYFVEKMSISYHDDDVYSYFEKTFPDLFD